MRNLSRSFQPWPRTSIRGRREPPLRVAVGRCLFLLATSTVIGCGGGGTDRPRVTVTREGAGRVASEPAGVDCGDVCDASFDPQTTVVLTATPATGQYFAGWSGGCSGEDPRCVVTPGGDVAVTASFRPAIELTVGFDGDGAGSVAVTSAGATCSDDCSAFVKPGSRVELVAAASAGSTFAGFSGDCVSSESSCTLTVDEPRAVHVRFVSPGGLVWTRRFGRETTDRGFGGAVDRDGNVVTTGYFDSAQADFGGGLLTNRGGDDVVVAKYRGSDGQYLWSASFGGPSDERGLAAAVDDAGDVYVTGFFQGRVAFGAATLVSTGARDIFVLKLAGESGQVLWARAFGTGQSDQGMGIAIARDGQPVVTGFFLGELRVGGGKLVGNGNRDVLVLKLAESDGTPIWARNFGDDDDDQGLEVASDTAGNLLLTGFFTHDPRFGSTQLHSHGRQDVFVAKLGLGDGHVIWALGFGASDVDQGLSVAGTADGHVAITGYFHGTDDLGVTRLASAGAEDVLVAKLDGVTGDPLWARSIGAASDDQGLSVAARADGDVVVTGFFGSTVDFGGGPLVSAGDKDIFVARLAGADGATRWARSFGGAGEDLGLAVALDPSGFVFVTGWFFDATQVGGEPLDTPILRDLLVFRLGP